MKVSSGWRISFDGSTAFELWETDHNTVLFIAPGVSLELSQDQLKKLQNFFFMPRLRDEPEKKTLPLP